MKQKVIGILGGMGPEATLDIFKKVIQNTKAKNDQEHIRIIIDNNPKIPDRTNAILKKGENPVPVMVQSGSALERAGADFIIIPCISAHFFIEELNEQLNLPIISAFEEIPAFVARVHPGIKRVGLLATIGTVQGGLFANKIRERGIVAFVPEPSDQERVNNAIYTIKSSAEPQLREESKKILIDVANHIIESGAQGIIAGCTEIPLVLRQEDISVPFFDSLWILARAAVREARGEMVEITQI